MPYCDISVIPSFDNLNIDFLYLSAKYFLKPKKSKLSGFLLIPYSPEYGVIWPITALLEVIVPPPSAENIASLSINALLTLFSWNTVKLVSSA